MSECKYCNPDKMGICADIVHDDYWTDRFCLEQYDKDIWFVSLFGSRSSQIKYCPMCGRNLKEQK